jgi:hypothetical protein
MQEVQRVIEQLSQVCDLIGLREHIFDGTNKGRRLQPGDPWYSTKDYMAHYGDPNDTQQVIDLFGQVGCTDEVLALRFILRHDEIVP